MQKTSLLVVNLKIFFFCFLIVLTQVALIRDLLILPVNLVFVSIVVLAALTSIYETVFASLAFAIFVSILCFDSQVPWFYIPIAFVASKFNPKLIADKLLLSLIYVLGFTPVVEIFNPSQTAFLQKILYACLSNTLVAIPLYFIIRFLFVTKRYNKF
jgi:hypothetical protein